MLWLSVGQIRRNWRSNQTLYKSSQWTEDQSEDFHICFEPRTRNRVIQATCSFQSTVDQIRDD